MSAPIIVTSENIEYDQPKSIKIKLYVLWPEYIGFDAYFSAKVIAEHSNACKFESAIGMLDENSKFLLFRATVDNLWEKCGYKEAYLNAGCEYSLESFDLILYLKKEHL